MQRPWIALAVGLLFACAAGVAYLYFAGDGQPLDTRARVDLLQKSGLPADFPIHPAARRMPQAPQGGLSYRVNVPVPDATTWVREALKRAGYTVSAGDLVGDDEFEYKTRFMDYSNRSGVSGAVIVREIVQRGGTATEIKILSQQDARLRPPALPAP